MRECYHDGHFRRTAQRRKDAHKDAILDLVQGLDRVVFKGDLTSMFPDDAFGRYLFKPSGLIPSSFQDETNYGMLESVGIDGGIAWPD